MEFLIEWTRARSVHVFETFEKLRTREVHKVFFRKRIKSTLFYTVRELLNYFNFTIYNDE